MRRSAGLRTPAHGLTVHRQGSRRVVGRPQSYAAADWNTGTHRVAGSQWAYTPEQRREYDVPD